MELEAALLDGTLVRLRRIRPDDKQMLVDGFAQLSDQSRYRRFFRQKSHLTESELRYLTEVDYVNHDAWIAFAPDKPGQPGLGVARWIRDADDPEIAEGAVTVIDPYQRRGLGKILLTVAAQSAIEQGVRAFRVWVLGENRSMIEFLQRLGAIPVGWEKGVLQMIVPLPEDLSAFESTPAPLILREVASGRLRGEADSTGGGTRLHEEEEARPRPDLNRRPSP